MREKPTVTISFAQSLDGRIATASGESRWISSEKTLRLAQKLRAENDGILVGIGTVLRDNPELTCRMNLKKSPVRIILDSRLSIPLDTKIVSTASRYKTMVFTTNAASKKKEEQLKERGVLIHHVHGESKKWIHLTMVLDLLAKQGIKSLLVEGGSKIITSFLASGLVSKLIVVTAPIIIGEGISAVGNMGVHTLDNALRPSRTRVRRVGEDLVWELSL